MTGEESLVVEKINAPPLDCSDLVHDVFVAEIVEIRAGRFRGDSSLITWLDGILNNKIKDLWRSLFRHRSVFASLDSDSGDDEVLQEHAAWSPNQWDEHIDVHGMLNRIAAGFAASPAIERKGRGWLSTRFPGDCVSRWAPWGENWRKRRRSAANGEDRRDARWNGQADWSWRRDLNPRPSDYKFHWEMST